MDKYKNTNGKDLIKVRQQDFQEKTTNRLKYWDMTADEFAAERNAGLRIKG